MNDPRWRAQIYRLISCLRGAIKNAPRPPSVPELEFLRKTANYSEFCSKLDTLGQHSASNELRIHAKFVALGWFTLAKEHLKEATSCEKAGITRATYTRAYYAAYNASKAARYLHSGYVSLKGDDHLKASEIPSDCSESDNLGVIVTRLYEHRLRADYDNWQSTASEATITPKVAVQEAEYFVSKIAEYVRHKYGVR